MKHKHVDPMLLPLRDPKKRELELKLLAEYVASGKVKRLTPVDPDRKDVLFGGADERLREIGTDDGNYRVAKVDDIGKWE